MTVADKQTFSDPVTIVSGVTTFDFDFDYIDSTDVRVQIKDSDDVITYLNHGTDYSVARVDAPAVGGTVTVTASLTVGDELVVYRQTSLTQSTSLPNQGPYFGETIEAALDKQIMLEQEGAREDALALAYPIGATASAQFPEPVVGKSLIGRLVGGVLQYKSDGPDVTYLEEAVALIEGLQTEIEAVAAIDTEIAALAAITAAVVTVSGVAANVTTVAAIAAHVTAVAGIDAEVSTVASIAAAVVTVAGIDAEVSSVAAIAAAVTVLAGISANVTTVAGIAAAVTTVAGNSAATAAVAAIAADVTTVAGIAANVTTVATHIADIVAAAADIANLAAKLNKDGGTMTNGVVGETNSIRLTDSDAPAVAGRITAKRSTGFIHFFDGTTVKNFAPNNEENIVEYNLAGLSYVDIPNLGAFKTLLLETVAKPSANAQTLFRFSNNGGSSIDSSTNYNMQGTGYDNNGNDIRNRGGATGLFATIRETYAGYDFSSLITVQNFNKNRQALYSGVCWAVDYATQYGYIGIVGGGGSTATKQCNFLRVLTTSGVWTDGYLRVKGIRG